MATKTLRELAVQYRDDVVTRIDSLSLDKLEYMENYFPNNGNEIDDFNDQIKHWQETLKQINDTLNTY